MVSIAVTSAMDDELFVEIVVRWGRTRLTAHLNVLFYASD